MKLFELQDRPEQEKNFPRDIMPQIRKGNLQDSPFTFEKGKIKIKKLKPVQNQRVKGMHDRAKQGFADGSVRPIVIDKNNYIVNGHHRYDVARGLDYKKVKVLKVNATIEELIEYFSDTSSSEPTYEEFMKQKLDSLMEMMEEWGVIHKDNKNYFPTGAAVHIWSEAVAYQASLEADFKRICLGDHGLYNVLWHPVKGFRGDKVARFRGIMGLFEQRRIIFNKYRKFIHSSK